MKMMMGQILLLLTLAWCSQYQAVSAATASSYLVETIPEDLHFNHSYSKPTYESWMELIDSANHSIDIASMYWTMLGKDVMPDPVPESKKGENIVNQLIKAHRDRKIVIRIAVNSDAKLGQNEDIQMLTPHAQIRQVNFTRLIGAGILHTKFLIIDGKDFYLGSANMDWRSLTHVKELGIVIRDGAKLTQDMQKIFDIYWYLGQPDSHIPNPWPDAFHNSYNLEHPLDMQINSDLYKIFLASSPQPFCPPGRTTDLDAILHIIDQADQFIYISVMDYFPMFLYKKPARYWPVIDDALRKAVIERNVNVRLMASHWSHTRASLGLFLKSLAALKGDGILKGSIETKMFTFPREKVEKIPFARVNHNKYMITDKAAYIGTSNWSADYFIDTGGAAIVLNVTDLHRSSMHDQLHNIFLRDWNSVYAMNMG